MGKRVKIINSNDEIDFENKVNEFINSCQVVKIHYGYSTFMNNRTIHRYSALIEYIDIN